MDAVILEDGLGGKVDLQWTCRWALPSLPLCLYADLIVEHVLWIAWSLGKCPSLPEGQVPSRCFPNLTIGVGASVASYAAQRTPCC